MIKWNLVLSFYLTLFIPLLYLVNLSVIYFTSKSLNLPLFVVILGLVTAAIGTVLWIISFYSLRKVFGVLPQKQKRIRTGIYKYSNHPMYIGIYLCFFGLSLAEQSWQGLTFLNLVLLPLLFVRAIFEEKNLTD